MSFFYLTPVKGELPVYLLEVIVQYRLCHLKKMFFKDGPSVYNEYVVEGSIYDNIGHFTLCMLSIMYNNREFTQFLINAECLQFKHRIANLTAYDIRAFSKKLLRTIKKHENVPIYIHSLQILCQYLMLKNIAQHISSTCNNNCTVHNIRLNFRQCLPLISKRLVELENGQAVIPCSRWKQFLLIIFKENLKDRINNTNLDPLKSDPRITVLLNKIKTEFSMDQHNTNILMSKDVDTASINFPPCMLNLHQTLREKHRLSHSQRFYYSLFLKDIGMPIEEAICFWRSEYKLNPNGHHSCCHSWKRDEKKYIYGIRHMYGLEGCKKNYTSVNCQRIQSIDNAGSEGGCPLKTFEDNKMIPLLKNCTDPMLSKINDLKKKHLYTSACMLLLGTSNMKLNECDNKCSFNFSPVKYYFTASKNVKEFIQVL